MTNPDGNAVPTETAELPKPRVTRTRWPFPLVWIVPLLAAAALAYYVYTIHQQHGADITIEFSDASGLRVRDTPLTFHGVQVGSVSAVGLNADGGHALVTVRIERQFEQTVARDGAQFWIVRPDLGGGMLSGLNTVISGPYMELSPGVGDANYHFYGLDSRPVLNGDGIRVILHTDRLAHLGLESPVYFRGIQVGAIQDIRFNSDATGVNITAFIWKRYAQLLRPSSKFWSVSGTDIHGSVFSGIEVSVNNLKALVAGGVAFATPDVEDAKTASDGANFTLFPEAPKEWLTWSAKIHLPVDDNPGQAPEATGDANGAEKNTKIK